MRNTTLSGVTEGEPSVLLSLKTHSSHAQTDINLTINSPISPKIPIIHQSKLWRCRLFLNVDHGVEFTVLTSHTCENIIPCTSVVRFLTSVLAACSSLWSACWNTAELCMSVVRKLRNLLVCSELLRQQWFSVCICISVVKLLYMSLFLTLQTRSGHPIPLVCLCVTAAQAFIEILHRSARWSLSCWIPGACLRWRWELLPEGIYSYTPWTKKPCLFCKRRSLIMI